MLQMTMVHATKKGCISVWADNYNENATIDDGSCELNACMSDWADNYDENATIDDGSCFKEGCMLEWADNYDPYATSDYSILPGYTGNTGSNMIFNFRSSKSTTFNIS